MRMQLASIRPALRRPRHVLSVRGRLLLLGGLMVLTTIGIGLFSIWSASLLTERTKDANHELQQEAIPLVVLASQVANATALIGEYALSPFGGDAALQRLDLQVAEIDAEIEALHHDPAKGDSFREEEADLSLAIGYWQTGVSRFRQVQDEIIGITDPRLMVIFGDLAASADAFLRGHEISILEAQEEIALVESTREHHVVYTFAVAGFTSLFLLAALFALQRSIVRPVNRVRHAAARVASGDFSEPLLESGPRELAELAASFNHMTQEVRRREADLLHNALHDRLTGLGNRAMLEKRLEIGIAYSGRYGGVVSLLLIDLDNFKHINDSYGHNAGDTLLVTVAERLGDSVDEVGEVIRLGGDEFAVVLDASSLAAEAIGERIRLALSEPVQVEERAITVTASIGVTTSYGEQAAEDLLRQADLAMYAAKAAGRDLVRCFTHEMHEAATDRMQVEADLCRAIADGSLDVHYQAVTDLASRATTGVEALVRWTHPIAGPIPPSRFIPLAEEAGLIDQLDAYVLRTALRDACTWLDAGAPDTFTLSVNASGHELQDEGFPAAVLAALTASGFPAGQLVVEITETALVEHTGRVRENLQALRSAGVRIALDDFGTGYTSLEYLNDFPADVIKIDRAFVTDLRADAGQRTIVRSIASLAHDFGAYVIAEGVEREDDAPMLIALGCRLAQGFAFHRPAPDADIHQMVISGRTARLTELPTRDLRRAS
ncbi:MAG: putative signal transduction protein [Chloroflexi bacterium]|nr:MAG: putative signal transduction protein [Chloroflexota bacterium]